MNYHTLSVKVFKSARALQLAQNKELFISKSQIHGQTAVFAQEPRGSKYLRENIDTGEISWWFGIAAACPEEFLR